MTTRLLLEGPDLAELMSHVRSELGPGARIVRAERIRSGGLGGFFARERYEITVDVAEQAAPRPRAALRLLPGGGLPALLAAADEADDVPGAPADADDEAPAITPDAPAFADVLEQVRGASSVLADVDVSAGRLLSTEPPAPVVPVEEEPAFVPAAPAVAAVPTPTPAPDDADLREALSEIGVPLRLLRGPRVSLSALLHDLPVAPPVPRAPGSVLVVVGADDDADAVATLLAERLRLPAEAVRPVGTAGRGRPTSRTRGARLTTAEQVASWRAGAAAAEHPWVVPLAVGPEPEDRAAARALADACRPDQVWAAVDARTRTADARRWMAAVAPRVDAAAVRGVLDTAEPGAALGLDVPVAWIDGVPATPVAWAAALSQALGDRARWD